jgi:hypothetical protein
MFNRLKRFLRTWAELLLIAVIFLAVFALVVVGAFYAVETGYLVHFFGAVFVVMLGVIAWIESR